MKLEEKLKQKYLYSKNINIFKIIYFISQILKSKLKQRKPNSNWGVDLIISNIFKKKKKGFYVDVGCNHPFINNHTNLLYKKGWSGINIDLDFNSIDMFDFFRSRDLNIQAAISNEKKDVDLFFYHNRAAINTISKDFAAGAKKIKKIKTETLDDILSAHLKGSQKIDFLSIDVEGNELNVLKGLNINKYKPTLIMLEYIKPNVKEFYDKNINEIQNSDIYKYMMNNNYKLINWNHDDLLFITLDYKNFINEE
tara:strand:+ start:609 stop:1367 length:759 start_codon:yes stop_codon:yes gene_type:complete